MFPRLENLMEDQWLEIWAVSARMRELPTEQQEKDLEFVQGLASYSQ